MKKIIIIGAGPTGLGAAYRLKELKHENFVVYERADHSGGLCSSYKDKKGFVWDLGGHVIFSHYKYYDDLVAEAIAGEFIEHMRDAWVRTRGLWVPYPFQSHIHCLPDGIEKECRAGLLQARRRAGKSRNFKEWVLDHMGAAIGKFFMFPYNAKVWAFPLEALSCNWITERVSKAEEGRHGRSAGPRGKNRGWGPNARFKYPLHGGVGSIFRKISEGLQEKIVFHSEVINVDPAAKKVKFANGAQDTYDVLINTSPLDKFVRSIKKADDKLLNAARCLEHTGVLVVGLGFHKPCPGRKSWVYFPDPSSCFFRSTYFSNYSPYNAPDARHDYSLLCETSYSKHKKETSSKIVEQTIGGLINEGLIGKLDKAAIVSKFLFDIDYAYPVPTLNRDDALKVIQPRLEKLDIYSRGRFGAWKYEVGNTDHSVMQGKEIVDKIIKNKKETVWRL